MLCEIGYSDIKCWVLIELMWSESHEYSLLEFYSDYLISSFALITAAGLFQLLDNAVSHN